MPNNVKQEELHYGVDISNGEDSTGLTIVKGEKTWGYIGEEAEVILALINQQVIQALEKAKSEAKDVGFGNGEMVSVWQLDNLIKEYKGEL